MAAALLVIGSLSHSWMQDARADENAADKNAADKPRLMILTDIGGDPDDQQSLVRLMLYSNEFQIEGLIASASGTPGELKKSITRPDLIRQIVDAYGEVRPRLMQHAAGYPEPERLRERIHSGNPQRGPKHIGEKHDTDGSNAIIRAADSTDPRPLQIAIFGGQTDLCQALWRVRNDRDEAGLKAFLARLRVYDIDDQDRLQRWIFENFPDLFYLLAKSAPGRDKREGAYRGMYLGGDESLTSREWLDEHVRHNHGPLGALYPDRTWTAPNPHGALKEGDTPSWFYFRSTALQDAAEPTWGGWGGRFRNTERGLWRDVPDRVMEVDQQGATPDPRASVWRWRGVFQRDFQARMDWCVNDFAKANHPPELFLGDATLRKPVRRPARAGSSLTLVARATDPDGDALSYRWWVYQDAGTCDMPAKLRNAETPAVTIELPGKAAGCAYHLILEATDAGSPPLTSLARVVLEVE